MRLSISDKNTFNPHISLLLLLTVLTFSACDVTSSDDDEHEEEHADPWGIVLIMNSEEIAKQEDSTISYLDGDYLKIGAGEESNLVTVRFLDDDGDYIDPDLFEEGSSLGWDIGNEDEEILEIEQHEEDGVWGFHFAGVSTGETQVEFHLLHGGHSDFTSMKFEVHVE